MAAWVGICWSHGRARGSETRKGNASGGVQPWLGKESGVQQRRSKENDTLDNGMK